jgi:hypothetical protein
MQHSLAGSTVRLSTTRRRSSEQVQWSEYHGIWREISDYHIVYKYVILFLLTFTEKVLVIDFWELGREHLPFTDI